MVGDEAKARGQQFGWGSKVLFRFPVVKLLDYQQWSVRLA